MPEPQITDMQIDKAELLNMLDFKKAADMTGIKELELGDTGKFFMAQMDYLQRLFESIFDMQSAFYIRMFGYAADKPKPNFPRYAELYQKHFPKGRQYYLDLIQNAKSDQDAMLKTLTSKISEIQSKIQDAATTTPAAPAGPTVPPNA